MRYDRSRFARMRDAWMLRRVLDARGGMDAGDADDTRAEPVDERSRAGDAATTAGATRRRRSGLTPDALMVEALHAGGASLPPSENAPLYRESLMAAAERARSELFQGHDGVCAAEGIREGKAEALLERAVRPAAPRRRVFTLPRVAAACFVILALLVGMGFASTYAMPGNPLYSVKRVMERARLLFTPGGESEANLLVASADRRLDELEYAGDREMTGWYASLAIDASRDIRKALAESRDLPEGKAAAVRSQAFDLMKRLSSLLFTTLADIPREQSEELQHGVEDIREELWPEGIPPDWVDPWGDREDGSGPVEPPVDTPVEPPVDTPVGPPAVTPVEPPVNGDGARP